MIVCVASDRVLLYGNLGGTAGKLYSCPNWDGSFLFSRTFNLYVEAIILSLIHIYIQLETLGEEYTSRREAAYEKAKSVVASIPQECNTDRKKAQYLYNYVAENSVYVTDGYSTRNVPIEMCIRDRDKARSTKIWVRNFTIPYPNAKR